MNSTPRLDAGEGDDNEDQGNWDEFLSQLSPAARAAMEYEADHVQRPDPPSEYQLLSQHIAEVKTLLLLRRDTEHSEQPEQATGLLAAAEKAALIGKELKFVKALANKGNISIPDLELAIGAEVPTTLKRLRPKLKRLGWLLVRRDNHISAVLYPDKKK